MRFITEFELEYPYTLDKPERYKSGMDHEMGKLLHESFGWKSKGNAKKERFTLELEAFPMDKWIEFKNNIISESRKGRSNRTNNIIKMIEELESFGAENNKQPNL